MFVFAISFQAVAQESDKASNPEQVNKLFESTLDLPVPGATVIVIDQGEIVHKKGYGLANIEKKIPNTPGTIFRLGSVTKQFTAMAILQLHDKQLLEIMDAELEMRRQSAWRTMSLHLQQTGLLYPVSWCNVLN